MVGLAVVSSAGCGNPPQMGADNYRLVAALQTAVTAHRSDWLENAARLAAERHKSGQLTDEQFAAIDSIVSQARGGEWAAAEAEVVRLTKAQRGAGP